MATWWLRMIGTVALLLMAGLLWWWLHAYLQTRETYTSLEILGPQVPDLALPVFAQFVVTQTMELPPAVRVSEIVVPMYIPAEAQAITVRLKRNGHLVYAWRHIPVAGSPSGVQEQHLELPEPVLLDGSVALEFDGQDIVYDEAAHAPRLFTESFDDAFPLGHYAIADNDKQGDIRLRFVDERTRWEKIRQEQLGSWPRIIAWLGAGLLLAALAAYVPFVVLP